MTEAEEHVSENDLLEYADGLLPAARAAPVAIHLDRCASCRAVLAELARDAPPATPAAPLERPPRPGAIPEQLLRDYLARDARVRELSALRLAGTLSIVGLVGMIPAVVRYGISTDVLLGMLILGSVLAYQLPVYLAFRRGWFHRAIPLVNTLVEISVFAAMQVVVARTQGATAVASSPMVMIVSGLIVFSAIRGDPRICLAAGAVAAVEMGLWYLVIAKQLSDQWIWRSVVAFTPVGAVLRSAFCIFAGVAGAILSRHSIRRAGEALREIREQDLFGKYILHERMGVGGMGEVVRATYCPEGGFSRTVAVKRVRADLARSPAFVEAIRREARLGAALAHPNLVQVLDCGSLRGAFMLAMELVDGVSLSRLLRARPGPLPLAAVTYLGAELAAALAYLHSRRDERGAPLGLVHCDLNPPNVLLSRLGEVKLGDLGVARAGLRQSAGFSGKACYAAPEHLRGEPLDGRADLFALGLTLHEASTGAPPIPLDATALTAAVPPLAERRPDAPRELCALVDGLLALDRAGRPQSAEEVRRALLAIKGDAAPYPEGEGLIAAEVEAALAAPSPHLDRATAHATAVPQTLRRRA